MAGARLAPQYPAGFRLHADSIGAAAVALRSGVNDSATIMYAAIPPYRAEDILIMASYLRVHDWSVFNGEREHFLGREFRRYYRVVAPSACRGEFDPVRGISDYRWSGFRFSGWAYDVGTRAPANGAALVDSAGRLIGMARSGFQRPDAPEGIPRERVGFLGYVPADLKAREVRAFAILADNVSACPMNAGAPLYLDLSSTTYGRLEPTGATVNLTRALIPAVMNIEAPATKPVKNGTGAVVEGANDENWVIGWIVDSNRHSGAAADLVVDDVPVRAEYGYGHTWRRLFPRPRRPDAAFDAEYLGCRRESIASECV